jgi:hypothetical protein
MILGPISTAGRAAHAQVGMTSGLAQVSLVVRAASQASMPAAGLPRRIVRGGTLSEAVVTLQLQANSGYRLVAQQSAGAASRVWVHVDGTYQELTPGSALTVSRERAGSSEREVRYMTDASTATAFTEAPIRFEMVVDPAI